MKTTLGTSQNWLHQQGGPIIVNLGTGRAALHSGAVLILSGLKVGVIIQWMTNRLP